MTADSVKLADVERLLAIGGAVTISVRLVYPLCSFVLVYGIFMDTDELMTEGSRTSWMLRSDSFTSNEWNLSAASEQHSKIKKGD